MRAPNKAERAHIQKVLELGCQINNKDCCFELQYHHVHEAGSHRQNHYEGFGLCMNHHGPQTPLPLGEAVHYGKKIFERQYGTQWEILEKVFDSINFDRNILENLE